MVTVVKKAEKSVSISCQLKGAGKRPRPTEGVILSGVSKRETGLYLDGSLENPVKGAEGVSRYRSICESLRQKDSEIRKTAGQRLRFRIVSEGYCIGIMR